MADNKPRPIPEKDNHAQIKGNIDDLFALCNRLFSEVDRLKKGFKQLKQGFSYGKRL